MFDLSNEEILALSKEHVFYTWSAQAKVNPIAVKRAKGVYFWDLDDRRYLDFNSMTMCVNIGHGDERVIKAMQEQAAELPYAAPGMTTKIRALASKTVADITPHKALSKVLFPLGGADANENAIKLARGYTGRHKILTRYRSYHGATAGAMAATGQHGPDEPWHPWAMDIYAASAARVSGISRASMRCWRRRPSVRTRRAVRPSVTAASAR